MAPKARRASIRVPQGFEAFLQQQERISKLVDSIEELNPIAEGRKMFYS